ncbi:hypothetical protein K435DRAFT_794197 [Dendrothele bispora CBS 962.96]|uniref:Uncharacterized protein n=1 Tax=Dendrothele bispora (strain CBS 962.96) TaxID=1314807 RepID=A0A4S8MCT6_DENBC|nr:hypothetical protein K435DRAFT_794197 [Dendrothele bispora CBS 962.96]
MLGPLVWNWTANQVVVVYGSRVLGRFRCVWSWIGLGNVLPGWLGAGVKNEREKLRRSYGNATVETTVGHILLSGGAEGHYHREERDFGNWQSDISKFSNESFGVSWWHLVVYQSCSSIPDPNNTKDPEQIFELEERKFIKDYFKLSGTGGQKRFDSPKEETSPFEKFSGLALELPTEDKFVLMKVGYHLKYIKPAVTNRNFANLTTRSAWTTMAPHNS